MDQNERFVWLSTPALLCDSLRHVNRHRNFSDYVNGLLFVEGSTSVEPMAAALHPVN